MQIRLWATLSAIAKSFIIIICASICIVALYLFFTTVTSRYALGKFLYNSGLERLIWIIEGSTGPENFQVENIEEITSDGNSIALKIAFCLGYQGEQDIPYDVKIKLGMTRTLSVFNEYEQDPTREILRQEHTIVSLSKKITAMRISNQIKVQKTYVFMQVTSIISILIGMITTILIGVSSTEFGRGEAVMARSVRVMAIIAPALGTAFAAIVAFYSPQAQWSQVSRTLASLTLLHNQMVIDIWNLECPNNENDAAVIGKLELSLQDWGRRFGDILTVSSAVSSAEGQGGQAPATKAGNEPAEEAKK